MSRAQKEKNETKTDTSLQIITKNAIEKNDTEDNCIEVTLRRRKRDADKPIYLRRI